MTKMINNKKIKRKRLKVKKLTTKNYKTNTNNAKTLLHETYTNAAIAFLVTNEFINDYNVTTGRNKHTVTTNNIAPNPTVHYYTRLKEYIENNGYTVLNDLKAHNDDSKVNYYEHTKILMQLFKESQYPTDTIYNNMNFGSSRYVFFPEHGISADILFVTPEFLLSAIQYHNGDKECTASTDYPFKNVIAHHFWNSEDFAFVYCSDLFLWLGLQRFTENFFGEMKNFSNTTISTMNNILFTDCEKSYFSGDATTYVAKRYVLAELIEHCNINAKVFKISDDVKDYFNDESNFSIENMMNKEGWELEFIMTKKVKIDNNNK